MKNKSARNYLVWIVIIGIILLVVFALSGASNTEEITVSELVMMINTRDVAIIEQTGNRVEIWTFDDDYDGPPSYETKLDEDVVNMSNYLVVNGAQPTIVDSIYIVQNETSALLAINNDVEPARVFVGLTPLLLVTGLFFLFVRWHQVTQFQT